MLAIDDLDLEILPVDDEAFARDPDPWMNIARAKHDWLARQPYGYVVTDWRAMKDLLPQDDKLSIAIGPVIEIMGAGESPWGRFMSDILIAKSGAEHARIRGALEPFFKPRSVTAHIGRIREVIDAQLDEWLPKGEFDFADFAANFPITVMMGLIGADPAVLPEIRDHMEVQGLSFSLDRSLLPRLEKAISEMARYVDGLIADRRASGKKGDDLLAALIEANNMGVLSDQEVNDVLIFLFGAGYDTSKNMLTLVVHMLLDHPEMWERCATDRNYCIFAVEEGLRLTSPSSPPRLVTQDIVYRGVLIPKGTNLMFAGSIAGRDPKWFPDPMTYNPDRHHENRHIAFGRGMHLCLGQHLARLQIEEGLHLITQRMKHPRLVGEVTWRPFPGVWGIRSMPIAFTPAFKS